LSIGEPKSKPQQQGGKEARNAEKGQKKPGQDDPAMQTSDNRNFIFVLIFYFFFLSSNIPSFLCAWPVPVMYLNVPKGS
jgi:hypothetical protein